MKRFLNLLLGGLLMLVVALAFAFATIRLAIHGTQVEVPNLAGLTASEAQEKLASRGLNLTVVSRFYSTTTPAGHILSQVPAPGVIVRQEWAVRGIESLGPQRVSIPDVQGMSERPAAITIRRLSLDLGTVARLPSPIDTELVLAQSPPPNASGVDSPRVSLLLSQKVENSPAFVMPTLIGLSPSAATSRLTTLGLNVTSTSSSSTAGPGEAQPGRTVVSQQPLAGYRIVKGETVHLTLGG